MVLRDKLNKLKESEIFKLDFDGTLLGFRIKCYNTETDVFDYFDFELGLLTDKTVIDFIKGIKDMRTVSLVRDGNGLLVSKAELEHGVVIKEFEDESSALAVLRVLMRVYAYKG